MARVVGKIIGATLGFVLGAGPMGAAIGLVVGHMYDRSGGVRARRWVGRGASEAAVAFPPGLDDAFQQSTYLIGVIVLGAKMAKADGRVSREEVAAFRRVFRVPDSQVQQVGRLFDQARQTAGGYEPYAMRLAQVFRGNPGVLEEILTGLFKVAAADSAGMTRIKANFLRRVAVLFSFSEEDFARIAACSGVPLPEQAASVRRDDPYAVLGLKPGASAVEIKRAYRQLIQKHHPDKLLAEGLPPELIDQATEKMKRINAAYAQICKARDIK